MDGSLYTVFILEHSLSGRTFLGITTNLPLQILIENGQVPRRRGSAYTKKYQGMGEWRPRVIIEDLRRYEANSIVRSVGNAGSGSNRHTHLVRRISSLSRVLQDLSLPCSVCV